MVPRLSSTLLIAALALICLIDNASGIKCYVCNSHYDRECAPSPRRDYLKDCSTIKDGNEYINCRIINQDIDKNMNGLEAGFRVIRQCGYVYTAKADYIKAGFGGRQNIHTCTVDACNPAPKLPLNYATIFVAAVLTSFVHLMSKFLV